MNRKVEDILIGIDGGGTKTEYCIHNLALGENTFFKYETTNYKNIGEAKTRENFEKALSEIFATMGINKEQIKGIAFGAAGYDTQKDEIFYKSLFENIEIPLSKVFICNDSDMILLSASEKPCICTAAGTGSIAVAYNTNDDRYRSGGWGSLISDQGSGYWIGQIVLSDLLLYIDGVKPYQPVFSKICDFLNQPEINNMPEIISLMTTEEIASVAKTVIDFANKDEYCSTILNQGVDHLVNLGLSLLDKLEVDPTKEVTMLLTGSLFKSELLKETYIKKFNQSSKQSINFVSSSKRPSLCGVMLAKNIFAQPIKKDEGEKK